MNLSPYIPPRRPSIDDILWCVIAALITIIAVLDYIGVPV